MKPVWTYPPEPADKGHSYRQLERTLGIVMWNLHYRGDSDKNLASSDSELIDAVSQTPARFFSASAGNATYRRVRSSPRQNSQRSFRCRCEYFAPVWGSLNTQSSAPEDGQNNFPKHVELTGIINKPLLLHLVGCLYYLYQWCTVKHISDNEIYLLIKDIKSVLWRVAKHLSLYRGRTVPKV